MTGMEFGGYGWFLLLEMYELMSACGEGGNNADSMGE